MTLLAATPNQLAAGQIALAVALAAAGFMLLLPRPRFRSVAGGTAALVAAAAVFGAWLHQAFGEPMADSIGTVLFALFSAGALIFGTVLVVQRNPARGAIAFAFVVLSTCGLFLLLAATFLMAATIIIYAGAIIVTFLFVLMLSQAAGPSDENDRSREPLLGSLAGFAFVGLVLFTLYQTQHPTAKASPSALPAAVLTPDEQKTLLAVAEKLQEAENKLQVEPAADRKELKEFLTTLLQSLEAAEDVVGVSSEKQEGTIRDGSIAIRLKRNDQQAKSVLLRVTELRDRNYRASQKVEMLLLDPARANVPATRDELHMLREEMLLLAGTGELPARNVANIGLLLYADHLFAVELAGTLLLVATIGSVAIAHRRPQ